VAVEPLAVLPSPKFQSYLTMLRPVFLSATDSAALKNTSVFTPGALGENRNTAVGAGEAVTVTVLATVAVEPRLSLTTRVTWKFPAALNVCDVIIPEPVVPSPKFQL
jgi:hypothetical protein